MPTLSPDDAPPADFDAYWRELLDELNALPPAAEETALPLRSDEHTTCYAVRLTSCGAYRIFGYLSIPREGTGPFPAYYYLPRYQSVMEVVAQGESVDKRRQCVTFSIACRGQRNADKPFAAEFPGLLTEGIEDPATYGMRGWVADCIRGLQYLGSRPEVDPRRIAGTGFNDLSLITAGLTDGLASVTSIPGLFYRTRELHPRRAGYPIAEFNDFARCFPDRTEAMHRTLNYFDPRWFADNVSIPTLLCGDSATCLASSASLEPLAAQISLSQQQKFTGSRFLDGRAVQLWQAAQLGIEAVLPEHWRS